MLISQGDYYWRMHADKRTAVERYTAAATFAGQHGLLGLQKVAESRVKPLRL
jgi:hypothetical protein